MSTETKAQIMTTEDFFCKTSTTNPQPDYASAKYKFQFGKKGNDKAGEFNWPMGISSSPIDRTVAISDFCSNKIHILTKDLDLISAIGQPGQGNGQFQCPFGVCFSPDNRIFISDQGNHRIQVLDSKGKFLNKFGQQGSAPGQFNNPRGLVFDQEGLLYVCDSNNYRVQVLKADGTFIRSFGERGKDPGQFTSNICVLALSSADNKVIVCDTPGNVYIFTKSGDHLETIRARSPPKNMLARGIAVDSHNNILMSDDSGSVNVLKGGTQFSCTVGSHGDAPGKLSGPAGIALTSDGDLLVCDSGNHRIQLFQVPQA